MSFTVVSVRPCWLGFQRVELVVDEDARESHFALDHYRFGGPGLISSPLRFAKGQVVRATVLWSPLWRAGATIPINDVLERCRPE